MNNNLDNSKTHRHFRLTEKDASHLLRSPGKVALFVALALTVFLCLFFIVRSANKANNNLVLPENNSLNVNQIALPDVNEYKTAVREIVTNYLDKTKLTKDTSSCQKNVSDNVNKILNLTVPLELKVFHLRLVVLLDQENKLCLNFSDKATKEKITDGWQKLLDEYTWLK